MRYIQIKAKLLWIHSWVVELLALLPYPLVAILLALRSIRHFLILRSTGLEKLKMRTSDIHSLKLDTLMAIFFNCDQSVDGNFVVKSTYRETKFLHMERESYGATSHQLSMKYGLEFNVNGSTIYAVILNNEHISLENFIDRVYQCILVRISNEVSNYNLDCEMALAMFLFRGSADFNRGYYSVDIKTNNPKYYDEMFKILLSSDELLSRLNLNFRELQHEYVVGKSKRNTQVRVNLKWFYDNVVLYYPHLNQYKTDVLRQNIMS